MLKIEDTLFSLWNDNNIVYCHWKGNGHLTDSLTGKSDFDILIDSKSLTKGCDLLRQSGFVLFSTQKGSRFPGIQDWIGNDPASGTMIHIHLHEYMIAGHSGVMEYILPWNELVFSSRLKDEETGIYLISPSLEIILLYSRLGIEYSTKKLQKGKEGWLLKDKTKDEISFLKERMNEDECLKFAQKLFPDCYKEVIRIIKIDALSKEDLNELFNLMGKACGKWRRYGKLITLIFCKYHSIELKFRGVRLFQIFKPAITKKIPTSGEGVSIAFIGQDGCGKSTVTLEIEKWLRWKIEARRFYLGSGDHYNGLFKRILHKGAVIKHKKDTPSKQKKPGTTLKKRKKSILNFIKTFMVAQNHLNVSRRAYKVVIQSEKYRKMGGTPLFDRFPQNQFEGIYDGPKIANYYRLTGQDYWIVKRMAKREEWYIEKIQNYHPNLIFKLLLLPEESIRRKPFENLAAVTQKHEITKKLVFKHSKVFDVDATQDYQEELIFIKNRIWEMLTKNL